ncbi:hypothetical protein [Azospirillum doebereinerae]
MIAVWYRRRRLKSIAFRSKTGARQENFSVYGVFTVFRRGLSRLVTLKNGVCSSETTTDPKIGGCRLP